MGMRKEEAVYKIQVPGEAPSYLGIWFSDNPAVTEGCDACIGYELYKDGKESDGGEMDYASEEKQYGDIADALVDVMQFALDLSESETLLLEYELTDMDLEDLREMEG